MDHHEALGLDRSEFEAALEHFQERTHDGITYHHLPDYRSRLDRGVVLFDDAIVPGFPKIPRTLVLSTGIPNHFDEAFSVEEKLNGYNVRIARVAGRVLAFTRSGIVCPYTTGVARDTLPVDSFFEAHPKVVLCGEMVGPHNPYTAHEYPEVDSIGFLAFDVRSRPAGEPMPVRDRRTLLADWKIPQPELFGYFSPNDAAPSVRAIIDDLDEAGREGVVMKATDGTDQLKYTTASANRDDLAFAFSLPFDYGQAFMFRRLIREAFQAVEWGESDSLEDRAHALGEAILFPMVETIETIDTGETVGEDHSVRGAPERVEKLLDHLRDMGLHLEIHTDERRDGERYVEFRKKTQATNDKTRRYLDGHIVTE